MDEYESLSHTKWECKYHVIFIPKYRRKALYGQLRAHLGEVFRRLAVQRESRIEEGHLMSDHVRAGVWGEDAQLRRTELLGSGVLCIHGRSRRGGDPRVHPQPGERGQAVGSAQALAIGEPPSGGSVRAGRVSDPFSRFERLTQ